MWLQVQRLLFSLADLFFMFMALIAQTSFFKGAFFFFRFQNKLGHFGGPAFFIEGDHGKEGRERAFFTFGFQVFDFDDNDDLHGAVPDIDDLSRTDDKITDKNGQMEFHFVDPGGDDVGAGIAARCGIGGRVHQFDDLAAVDIAGDIGLVGHHDFTDNEPAFRGCFFQV